MNSHASNLSFLLFVTLTSLLNMGTACGGCPDDTELFSDAFDYCAGVPCGWSAETGAITRTGGLRLEEGTTARRDVSIQFNDNEISAVEYFVGCETGGTAQFDANGPDPLELSVRASMEGELQRVLVNLVNAERTAFLVEEIMFTTTGGACTVEALSAVDRSYCD